MAEAQPVSYADSGVDIERGDDFVKRIAPLAAKTQGLGAMDGLGGFGGFFDIGALGLRDPLLVAGTDGVGSKLEIAAALGRYEGLGADLVAMCVNDIICHNAAPLFFLDYFATHRIEPDMNEALVAGIASACIEAGCQLLGGESAEMPGLYASGRFDLAGFALGAVERNEALPRSSEMREADQIWGVASSGLHSNGYSLIRMICERSEFSLDDVCPGSSASFADLLLEPTRIYARPALEAAPHVLGYAHITGGGLLGNLTRIIPEGLSPRLDLGEVAAPALAKWAIEAGHVALEEAQRVWNMGVGFAAIIRGEENAREFKRAFEETGFKTYQIGALVGGGAPTISDKKFDNVPSK